MKMEQQELGLTILYLNNNKAKAKGMNMALPVPVYQLNACSWGWEEQREKGAPLLAEKSPKVSEKLPGVWLNCNLCL